MTSPLRIANCSGFYGDRLAAAREMVEGGPVDVLTGDWLAELTMLILFKDTLKDPGGGYAKTFVRQVEDVLGTCLENGTKIVSNAGGLNPRGCAAAVQQVAERLGLQPRIACVTGDDLRGQLEGLDLRHLDTGEPLGDRTVLTANAYLGGWGIAEALSQGADVVVTGRTTDASLVVGPAAWHHGWARDDWDALAGAVVAGHVIECGTQATGGNYCFFTEVPGLEHPGFPIAEVAADGSSVITKHEGSGGLVSVGTVTAQLLYEVAGPRYLGPDVTTRFDTVRLEQVGPDRVSVTGAVGEPPPATAKLCLNVLGGTKATYSLPLVGLEIEAKAALLERQLLPDREAYASVDVDLVRTDHEDPSRDELAAAQLRITLKDSDADKVGKQFQRRLVEVALGSVPGFHAGPTSTTAYGVYWPALCPPPTQVVELDGTSTPVLPTPAGPAAAPLPVPEVPPYEAKEARKVPLGLVVGARSGDKGGNANLGVWVRTDEAFPWLAGLLTVDGVRSLMPVETAGREVEVFLLPHLRAVNVVLHGLLGEGVASSSRTDPQAKGLGEYLRAKHVAVPVELLP